MPDFKSKDQTYYDILTDYGLIESSFCQQYGIRLRKEDNMGWGEFCVLLSGLNGDTPLGNIVRIRSEKDPEVLKTFTAAERQIRAEWHRKAAKKITEEELKKYNQELVKGFQQLATNIR